MRQVHMLVTATLIAIVAVAQAAHAQPAEATPQAQPIDESSVSREAKIAIRKLEFAIKDLTPEQRAKSMAILAEFGPLYEAIERKQREEHEATLQHARQTRTPIDMKASQLRRDLRSRQMRQVEARYFDRIRDEVLTPDQKIKWDGYRLHLVAAFQLSMLGLTQDQNRELGPLAEQVAKELAAQQNEDGYQLFQRRLTELKARAAEKYFNEEQKQKLDQSRKSIEDLNRQLDQLEAQEGGTNYQPR